MADHVPPLGTILTGRHHRDAVHIAVAPVVAACRLRPGQPVCVDSKDLSGQSYVHPIGGEFTTIDGIVDPLLRKPVEEGEQFYLWLLPQTVTGLRHSWTHPAFPDEPPT